MKNMVCVISLALFAFLSSGCSKSIEGEAFVGLGSGATKLAQVKIQVVPEDAFISHIKKQLPKAAEEIAWFQKAKESAEKDASIAQNFINASAFLKLESAAISFQGALLPPPNNPLMASAKAAINAENNAALAKNDIQVSEVKAQMEFALKTVQDHERSIRRLSTGASRFYFLGKIDGALLSTESDSNGKFKLSFENEKRVVLVATKDDLAWALWLTPENSKSPIKLTDTNVSGSGCNNCVFDAIVSPKSLAGSS